jgi:Zn-dependent protease with chaperone function
MFALRCVDVSLAFFVALYCLLSCLVTRSWKPVAGGMRRFSPRFAANMLFGLRIAPFFLAASVTAIFVLPSFVLLEPRTISEHLGETPLALSACCLAFLIVGIHSAVKAQSITQQAVALWLREATPIEPSDTVPVYRIRPAVPALTVAGVCLPKVLVSDAAAAMLTSQEMKTALRHEMAHVRHWDNLKKLIFRFTVFPGMTGLELAWSEYGEMAADDAAVTNAEDALDLASALIKLSRLVPSFPEAMLATALVQGSRASINARVERLVAWQEPEASAGPTLPWFVVPTGVGACIALIASYSSVLMDMHKLTDWLVR